MIVMSIETNERMMYMNMVVEKLAVSERQIDEGKVKDAFQALEEHQKEVRNMVLESYQDMVEGKGRDYRQFFAEMENKYKSVII